MICNHLTQLADQAGERYNFFTEGLRSLYHRSITTQKLGTNGPSGEAGSLAGLFLETEMDRLEADLNEIAEIARAATLQEIASVDASGLSDEALEHVSVSGEYLNTEIIAQVSRDIATLRKSLQRVALEVSLSAKSNQKSQRTALIEYMLGNRSDIQFFFHDKASRKWQSRTFVRSIWRHTLLSVYNEVVLMTLAEHGLSRAVVEHHSPNADYDGMVIALSSNTELPTYSEIRETVFHPNANAWLKMEGARVFA